MLRGLLRSRPVADRLSQLAIDQARRVSAGRRVIGYVLLFVLFVLAVIVLILLNLAVRRLWGELLYAIVVLAVGLWALGQTRVARETLPHFGVHAFSMKRALLWSAFALVAVPVAIVHWPYGPFVLAFGPLFALVLYLRRRPGSPELWKSPWVSAAGGFVLVVAGGAILGPQLGAARPAQDAPAAAAERPEDRALAERVRPILFFDDVERRFPVDIETAVERDQVRACRDAVLSDPCPHVTDAGEVDLGADYLKFQDVDVPRGGDDGSAYYYRVIDRAERIYVDFWWFFTRNPTPVAGGALCAPGFRLPGATCHDHEADWEGVTVVLGPCRQGGAICISRAEGRSWAPIAVRYAQHEFLVSYAWEPTLRRVWSSVRRDPLRPLVYVARDSHASYARPCARDCRQIQLGLVRREGTHDGRTAWHWNGDPCEDCLKPLPVTGDGKPAEWNAFEGRWGTQHCLLGGAYCDTTGAPRAPPEQDRYEEPWQPGPWVCLTEPGDPDSTALRRCARSVSPEGPLPR
ncbi:MAG TPA: hypothetical protein VFL61_02375 [Gaiellaceae bacterium]|nr:hypothetical protein [Gaiellaceae bacterium]